MNSQTPPPSDPETKPIALVGMMGVGKTSIGKRLAQKLKLPFVDADQEIVDAAGLSIPEIFEKFGEPHFRDGERRVIARLLDGRRKIIATGGGAFINAETRRLMLDRAIVIWLDADIDTLVERTARKGDRPLLAQGDPREILTRLAAERNPIYAEAHIHVKSMSNPHETTLEKILKALK
ncbi:MAG: shikimate kinase [Alphaproteobacteria bacterium]|nr:shikimate kinase [Alphaproteobacteria bacterium]